MGVWKYSCPDCGQTEVAPVQKRMIRCSECGAIFPTLYAEIESPTNLKSSQ